jgi:hypothetical protein
LAASPLPVMGAHISLLGDGDLVEVHAVGKKIVINSSLPFSNL